MFESMPIFHFSERVHLILAVRTCETADLQEGVHVAITEVQVTSEEIQKLDLSTGSEVSPPVARL